MTTDHTAKLAEYNDALITLNNQYMQLNESIKNSNMLTNDQKIQLRALFKTINEKRHLIEQKIEELTLATEVATFETKTDDYSYNDLLNWQITEHKNRKMSIQQELIELRKLDDQESLVELIELKENEIKEIDDEIIKLTTTN
jgi:hypothetical protein